MYLIILNFIAGTYFDKKIRKYHDVEHTSYLRKTVGFAYYFVFRRSTWPFDPDTLIAENSICGQIIGDSVDF